MPAVARNLIQSLQTTQPILTTDINFEAPKTVLVVLGGGRYAQAPEYDSQDEVSPATLERLRYAAKLNRELKLPLLLSGGRRNANATPEAVMMNRVMVDEYDIHPIYLEVQAQNTHQQAIEVKKILDNEQIERLILITHAWHMPRAKQEFEFNGVEVIAAPMGYLGMGSHQINYIPSAAAMAISSRALHEHYALIWLSLDH